MVSYDTRNWLALLLRFRGTVLPRIATRVAIAGGFGVVASVLLDRGDANLAIPPSVHTLVGVALGLLLVFRTNASYDRFWEGRRLIGAIVNNSRDLARQTASFLDQSSPAVRRTQGDLIVALYATIRRYLRGEREWPELATRLSAAQRAELATKACPPLLVARWLSDGFVAEARAGRISEHRLIILDNALSDIVDCFSGCERILRTPVPFAYAHHIKGFLTLFCFTVPMALLASMGWFTGPASAVVAYALFGIDEIGVEIEDPFGYDANDLPLDQIGDGIATVVDETVAGAAPSVDAAA
ncbi:MAG: bestrophin [Kofleriaceae bacterium]|nr:bestrophin [Kofleriaceae bacterium]MCB9572867.1 bestrophin [Kofleriaceae bacterium]